MSTENTQELVEPISARGYECTFEFFEHDVYNRTDFIRPEPAFFFSERESLMVYIMGLRKEFKLFDDLHRVVVRHQVNWYNPKTGECEGVDRIMKSPQDRFTLNFFNVTLRKNFENPVVYHDIRNVIIYGAVGYNEMWWRNEHIENLFPNLPEDINKEVRVPFWL